MNLTQSALSGSLSNRIDTESGNGCKYSKSCLQWEVSDFYGTTILCEESSNGSLVSSIIVNDTFLIPDSH